ncbi:MAG: glucosyltransferase domain-containing protein [Desulfovibrio sp.]|jgi:hypothetical protein|nr:glucosyltransferase domain-containing protein [Desulfovibrio sp.]
MRLPDFLFKEIKTERACLTLFALYCLGLFAILRADRLYLDDMGRSLYAYADWDEAGRPLADLLSGLFFLSPGPVDASPFTQILAAALLTLAVLTLCRALSIPLSPFVLAACLPFGLSPYGLENLSYRFDAPLIAMSQLLCILPFLWLRRARVRRKKFFALCFVCLFASLSIYQAGVNIYLAVSLFIFLRVWCAGKKKMRLLRLALLLFSPALLALVAYAAQASLWFDAEQYGDYVALHSVIASPLHLPGKIAENIGAYLSLLTRDWGCNSLGALFLILVHSFFIVIFRRVGRGRKKLPFFAGAALLIFCFLLTPLGVQISLETPVWSPRTFCAFGVLLTLMLLSLRPGVRSSFFARLFACSLVGFIGLHLLIFSSLYGNMLSAQNRWEEAHLSLLASELGAFREEKGGDKVIFTNSAGYSPLMAMVGARYPLIRRMTVVPLTRNMRWGYEQLKIYGITVRTGGVLPEGTALTLYRDAPFFRIETSPDSMAVVTFKNSE